MPGERKPDKGLSDFYHGWVITVFPDGGGYRCICVSATRQRLHCKQVYTLQVEALKAGRDLINRYAACSQLGHLLRDLYQAHKLTLMEWRSLNSSLLD